MARLYDLYSIARNYVGECARRATDGDALAPAEAAVRDHCVRITDWIALMREEYGEANPTGDTELAASRR